MRKPLSATDFLNHFEKGETEKIAGCEVYGNVVLNGKTVARSLRALDVTFWGTVDFSECRFERSLDLSGCSFAKGFILKNSHIGGTLDLGDVSVRTEPSATFRHLPDTYSIDLRGVRVEKDFSVRNMHVGYRGGIKAANSELGDFCATGVYVGGIFDLSGLKTDGSVMLNGSDFGGDVLLRTELGDASGSTDITVLITRHFSATNCRFAGNLELAGAEVGGDVLLWSSTINGVLFVRQNRSGLTEGNTNGISNVIRKSCHIGGDLNLITANINYVDIEAVLVNGDLVASASNFNQFVFRFISTVESCAFGRIRFQGCRFENEFSLTGVTVHGHKRGSEQRGVLVHNCTLGGSMRLWSVDALEREGRRIDETRGPDTLKSLIHGDLEIVGCTIDGELDLTNCVVSGRIILDDTVVKRDLSIRSFSSSYHLLQSWRVDVGGDAGASLLGTFAQAMSMNNLHCENEVDLTGLSLSLTEEEADGVDFSIRDMPLVGNLDANGCVIRKRLQLFVQLPSRYQFNDKNRPTNYVVVPGALNLSSAAIGELALSYESFEPSSKKDRRSAEECGLILANAQIDEFSMGSQELHLDRGVFLRLPRPLDLRDTKVGQWNIFDLGKSSDPRLTRRLAYASVGEREQRFRRSTYINLENALRNRGHAKDADHVYRVMMRRGARVRMRDALEKMLHWPRGAWLSGLILYPLTLLLKGLVVPLRYSSDFLFDKLLGFGTQPWRLLFAIFLFWGLMQPVFKSRLNYEPSLAILGAEANRFVETSVPIAENPPDVWTISSALATSLEFHLPVISLHSRDEWSLRDTGSTCYNYKIWFSNDRNDVSRECIGVSLPLTPEDTGIFISILNWIAWPFVLAFAIDRFVRVNRSA